MNTELTVVKSTPTETGNFSTKLVAESSVKSVFGNVITRSTYYMFTDQQNELGTKGTLDLSQFNIIEKEFRPEDSDDVILLKQLVPKE